LRKDPSLATVCGLILGGAEKEGETSVFTFPRIKIGGRIKKLLRTFIP